MKNKQKIYPIKSKTVSIHFLPFSQIVIQPSDDSNSQEIRLSLLSAFENISFILSFNPGFLVLSSSSQEHADLDLLPSVFSESNHNVE
ncbi:hypothetical protein E1A91_D05G375600v1 [Gossypium mustelinum]|uniref:Uncharacterized protein n=1 Tax=Gossypium mustelinum TaxID=34275 RepID=A0A5D2V5D5_GOSMU|nr:hypothetical protein E1A91_D05G375600v1 [Gossypium mustelinum]TYI84587.1 hypothetical protein E1A91_D05G375600v1 [Gossypium mustelinum]